MGEINLTPMMDLAFVLLITFIITFPIIEKGVQVKLPNADSETVADSSALVVTLDENRVLYLDNKPINTRELEAALLRAKEANPEVNVLIRGDHELPYGEIMDIVDVLQRTKITNMGLVTQGG